MDQELHIRKGAGGTAGKVSREKGLKEGGESPVLALSPPGEQRGSRETNNGKEWLFSNIFSVQKETE